MEAVDLGGQLGPRADPLVKAHLGVAEPYRTVLGYHNLLDGVEIMAEVVSEDWLGGLPQLHVEQPPGARRCASLRAEQQTMLVLGHAGRHGHILRGPKLQPLGFRDTSLAISRQGNFGYQYDGELGAARRCQEIGCDIELVHAGNVSTADVEEWVL